MYRKAFKTAYVMWEARSKPTRHQTDNGKLSQEADTNYLIGPKVFIPSLKVKLE